MWNTPVKIYLESNKNELNKKIGEYLLNLGENIFNTNLSAVAKELGISPSTVSKFLNKCGYEGWKVYTTFAYISLNRNTNKNESDLAKQKSKCYEMIDLAYKKVLSKLADKIFKSKKVILVGHQSTRSYLDLFKRNLRVIGKQVESVDMSDKYYGFEDKGNSVIIVVSFSGQNSNIKDLTNKLSKLKLATKVFISPSHESISSFDTNITLLNKQILFSNMERAIPIVKISFLQHCIDIITTDLINQNHEVLYNHFKEIGIYKRIQK